jgi:hypothetical protein
VVRANACQCPVFIFGQSLLFLERGMRKRAQLIAKSAEKLLDDPSRSAAGE